MSTRCRVQAVGTLKYKRQRTHNGLEKCPARCAWRCARAISRRPTCWSGNGSANNVYHREGSSRTAGGVRFCPPLREQGSLHWCTFRCATQLHQLPDLGNCTSVSARVKNTWELNPGPYPLFPKCLIVKPRMMSLIKRLFVLRYR